MPEDYYSDAAPPAAETSPDQEPQADTGQTGSLPASVFPEPPKVGDRCEFEVVSVNGDQVEVRYSTMEEEPAETGQPGPPSGNSEMASLME